MTQDIITKAKNQISDIVLLGLGNLVSENKIPSEVLPGFKVEIPADSSHGDFSCNVALVSSKELKKNPREIAIMLLEKIQLNDTFFSKCEVAGPGFLNFYLDIKFYLDVVRTVLREKENYGRVDLGRGKRILVEFVSANPTGPMHIGNARGGALGDCLSSVLEFAGYYVEREFYVNDAGNQIDKFGLSLDIRYRQEFGDTIEMPEDSYHGEDIINHVKDFSKIYGESYLSHSEEERRVKLIDFALPRNILTLENDLLKYRIKYDTWFKESSLHNDNSTIKIVELLKSKGYTYEDDGAVWFKATEFGLDKDIVLIRNNGVPTYIVPDIAYHYNKLITRKFDMAIDILGADHHGYKARMEAVLSALNIDVQKLNIIICQMVRLVRSGETVKLSKRSGKSITLSTLLDEVPIDAARFFFNLRDSNTHLDFDLDLAIEESSKNPVYYVQYAHARICSIIGRLAGEGAVFKEENEIDYTEQSEFDLIRKIAAFPTEITSSAIDFNPSRLTRYIVDLASAFHKFYDNCRIKGESNATIQSRLALCIVAKTTIKNVLDILKVDAPSKM